MSVVLRIKQNCTYLSNLKTYICLNKRKTLKRRWTCEQHVMRYVTWKEGKPWNETGEKLLGEDANGKENWFLETPHTSGVIAERGGGIILFL